MPRLTKRDAQAIIGAIDTPQLGDVVHEALGRLLACPGLDWSPVIAKAGLEARWTPYRVALLQSRDGAALETLAIELSELRTLQV